MKTLLITLALVTGAQAHAQMTTFNDDKPGDWSVMAGAAVASIPRYPGAKTTRTLLLPDFDIRYRDFLVVDALRGAGLLLQPAEGLQLRTTVGFSADSRRVKDDARFQGLQDIKASAAVNLGAEYKLGDAFFSAEYKQRVGKRNGRGSTLDLGVGYNLIDTSGMRLGVGLTARQMDTTYARNFFGIDAAQAVASGLRAYTARGGNLGAGGFVQGAWQVDKSWLLSGSAQVLKLGGDAVDSPVVVQKRQSTFVLSLMRVF